MLLFNSLNLNSQNRKSPQLPSNPVLSYRERGESVEILYMVRWPFVICSARRRKFLWKNSYCFILIWLFDDFVASILLSTVEVPDKYNVLPSVATPDRQPS